MNIPQVESIVDYANRIYPPISQSKVDRYGWTTKGAVSDWRSYELVSVSKLKIDHSYQRPISKSTCDTITTKFDYIRFEPLKVSKKTMCVVDGSNRGTAAVRRGMEFVPVIYLDLTKQEEAEYFLKLNDKKNLVSSIDMFKAELCAGDADSIAIQKMCKEIGITISKNHGDKGQCQFVGQIKQTFKKSPENTMDALKFSYYMAKDEALSGIVFIGAFDLLQHGIDMNEWSAKCYKSGAQTEIISNYNAIIKIDPKQGRYIASRKAILRIINKGLRRNKITIE